MAASGQDADSTGTRLVTDDCTPPLAFARSLTVTARGAALSGWSGVGECSGVSPYGLADRRPMAGSGQDADSMGTRQVTDDCTPPLAFARSLKVAARGAALSGWSGTAQDGPKRVTTGRRGSVLIETALVLSVLLAILIGMADLARYLLVYDFVAYAAQEGTRYAEVHGASSVNPATADSMEKYVRRFAVGVRPEDVRVKAKWTPDNQPGSLVTVEVAVPGLSATSEVVILH